VVSDTQALISDTDVFPVFKIVVSDTQALISDTDVFPVFVSRYSMLSYGNTCLLQRGNRYD
jgi:hypothetical protein